MAPNVRRVRAKYPELTAPHDDAPRGARFAAEIAAAAVEELYNPAQVDVFRRIREVLDDDQEGPG